MSDPFVGEVMLVGFNFPPVGYAFAAGQIMAISSNTALFSLLGTIYGGDGRSNFALPNLQGNVALGFGQGPGLSIYDQGQTGGTQSVTLLQSEVPSHNHTPMAGGANADKNAPAGNSFAKTGGNSLYNTATSPLTQMAPTIVPPVGGSQPHNNMMPYQGLNWVIALRGIYPARS